MDDTTVLEITYDGKHYTAEHGSVGWVVLAVVNVMNGIGFVVVGFKNEIWKGRAEAPRADR
jgi:hypothetical protein